MRILSIAEPKTPKDYVALFDYMSRTFSINSDFFINNESKIFEKVVNGDDSVIFIMNHSNQKKDPSMLAVLNFFLTQACKNGAEDKFKVPKVVLNNEILSTMNPTTRKVFEKFSVGIDANVNGADKGFNARAFMPMVKDFLSNKCNIFIFPEGRLAVNKNLPLENRFQDGTAELINKVLGIKKSVTVVPVAFAYSPKKRTGLNLIEVGEPIVFKRTDDRLTTSTAGNITDLDFVKKGFADFFGKHKGETDVVITKNQVPVDIKNISRFINGILCENLGIVVNKATKKLEAIKEKPKITWL